MMCPTCRTENDGGREKCVVCGNDIVQVHRIIARDRWAGRLVAGAVIGCISGGAIGALIGALFGMLLGGREAGVNAVTFGYAGMWLGGKAGTVIGALAGIATS